MSALGASLRLSSMELREATGDESRVQRAVLKASFHVKRTSPELTVRVYAEVRGREASLPPGRACDPTSVAAIRVERGPERSGCFT